MANDEAAADKPSKEDSAQAGGGGRKKSMLIGIVILGLMAAEGAGVFFIAKKLAGPPAQAKADVPAGLDEHEGKKPPHDIEVEVVKFRAQNEKSQQLIVYDITVAAVFELKEAKVPEGEKGKKEEATKEKEGEKGEGEGAGAKEDPAVAKIAQLLMRKRATLQDRFGRVVRSLDPQRFSEPDLSTLRQQFQYELSQVVGEEAIVKEVLIPSIVRYNEN